VLRGNDVQEFMEMKRAGLSIQAISELTGYDRKTVRKHLLEPEPVPSYGPRAAQPSKQRSDSCSSTSHRHAPAQFVEEVEQHRHVNRAFLLAAGRLWSEKHREALTVVQRHQNGTMHQVAGRVDELGHLVLTQHNRYLPRP
jgi:hypothetical protein